MPDERKIFSLHQLALSVKRMFEKHYDQLYWVKVEMHKLNQFPSGHCFPELVQKENGKIVVQMSATIWKTNYQIINKKFIEIVKEPLKEGANLLVQVQVVFSEIYGLSLQIKDIDPSFSLGELHKERQETIEKLGRLDIFDKNQRLKFPLLAKRIAVISAESSKGLLDFYRIINENVWNYKFETEFFQAYLQGDAAANSIISQLTQIEKRRNDFDVVVIVRGGGGEVGLTCYNNFDLCRAIAEFPLPVLTGIGHSTNFTVAEMVAFRNAITPTQLGEFLIQNFHDFSVPVQEAQKSIIRISRQLLNDVNRELLMEMKSLIANSKAGLQENLNEIQNLKNILKIFTNNSLSFNKEELRRIDLNLLQSSKNIFKQYEKDLSHITQLVKMNHPELLLKKGYSITTYNGKILKQDQLPPKGKIIKTIGYGYELESETLDKTKNNGRKT